MKTKFDSYCINGVAEGCGHCVKGKKLVLFISGKCSRNCNYCSLSSKRKNVDVVWANERICKSPKDAIEEAKESNSDSIGITGGNPLFFLRRTEKYIKSLKKSFKKFHAHIYIPLDRLVNEDSLKKLSSFVDEIRFHPNFLSRKWDDKIVDEDIERIKLANLFFKKKDIGCEMPMIPDRKEDIFKFIKLSRKYLGFINLNEFEISETNFDYITKKYKLNKDTYTIKGSKESGLWVLKKCKKYKIKIKVHLCTAKTKNWHQYANRIKIHKIMPYGRRTKEGMVIYLSIQTLRMPKEIRKSGYFIDKKKKRIILSEKSARILLKAKKYKIKRSEEYPTYDSIEAESWFIN